ncbi:DUF6525 family protein [Yoonia vestfoldensis]
MMRRNLATTLRGKPRPDPMRDYDALPPPLRQWLATARLPWSPRSARRIWSKHGGDATAALASLDRAERATLARDIPKTWGKSHPAAHI